VKQGSIYHRIEPGDTLAALKYFSTRNSGIICNIFTFLSSTAQMLSIKSDCRWLLSPSKQHFEGWT